VVAVERRPLRGDQGGEERGLSPPRRVRTRIDQRFEFQTDAPSVVTIAMNEVSSATAATS
jgi:hypothetical protein